MEKNIACLSLKDKIAKHIIKERILKMANLHISKKQIEDLYEVESYFWDHTDWKENKETEEALYKLWNVVEELLVAKRKVNEHQKLVMREKRKINPQYGRNKEKALAYQRKYYKDVVKPKIEEKKKAEEEYNKFSRLVLDELEKRYEERSKAE